MPDPTSELQQELRQRKSAAWGILVSRTSGRDLRTGQAIALPRKLPRLAKATSQSPSSAQATDPSRQPRALAKELGRSHHCKEQVAATSPPARKSHRPEIPSRRRPAPGATELWTRATATAHWAQIGPAPPPQAPSLEATSELAVGTRHCRAPTPWTTAAQAERPPTGHLASSRPHYPPPLRVEVAVGAPPCPPPLAARAPPPPPAAAAARGGRDLGVSGL
jgi:hypothetical protein